MSKPTLADLAALLPQLKQFTERASAALDATLRSLDERFAALAAALNLNNDASKT